MKQIGHWDVLNAMDPELNEKVQIWRKHINEKPSLERKYKELMMVAMSCVLRFPAGIEGHARFALQFGATKEEIFAAIEESFFTGGIPAFREGALIFFKMFPDTIQEEE